MVVFARQPSIYELQRLIELAESLVVMRAGAVEISLCPASRHLIELLRACIQQVSGLDLGIFPGFRQMIERRIGQVDAKSLATWLLELYNCNP